MTYNERGYGSLYVAVPSIFALRVFHSAPNSRPTIRNDKAGRCAGNVSGHKAIPDQPFCSTTAIPSESREWAVLVRYRQAVDESACERNVEVTPRHQFRSSDVCRKSILVA